MYENYCDCSGSASEFVMRYCEGGNKVSSDETKDEKLMRKLVCLGLNSQHGVSSNVNANAYDKALFKFYSKESEEIADFVKKLRDAHVVRERVSQVDQAIKKVIFNDPATIILWKDGSKTVVKCGEHEKYDPEKGFAMALAKHYLGDKGRYYNLFKKYLPEKTFTPDDEVLVRAKIVGSLSTKKGNTKYIVKIPGYASGFSVDKEYLVGVKE